MMDVSALVVEVGESHDDDADPGQNDHDAAENVSEFFLVDDFADSEYCEEDTDDGASVFEERSSIGVGDTEVRDGVLSPYPGGIYRVAGEPDY